MDEYSQSMKEEQAYLADTLRLLKQLIDSESDKLAGRKKELITSRKEMWENSSHHTDDFDRLTEMNQHLQQVQSRTNDYESIKKNIAKYNSMIDSPYFGKFEFIEDNEDLCEKIYIGKGNVADPKNRAIIVYDWRAPISSMYYRFEPGKASFKAPFGEISGEMKQKRQYKIINSELKYFFDCSIQISDEMLQEVLGRNSSTKMKSIIETIQREQDIVIRDTESELLIVQGAAGSGKTSIALHRVAFLLYEGMSSKLGSNNILILSPNDAFNNYIGQVLPELGEENVERATMEGLVKGCLGDEIAKNSLTQIEGRSRQLEACISGRNGIDGEKAARWVEFKGSLTFKEVLDRYISLFEHKLLKFEDIYYHGQVIAGREELKSAFLDNKTDMPAAKRLDRIKSRIMDSIGDLRKDRLRKLETIVQKSDGHEFEIKSFSRLLLMKDSQAFAKRIQKFTEVNVFSIYRNLFKDKARFYKLAKGLELPGDIEALIENTALSLENKSAYYEDLTAMAYIKLRTYGADTNQDIRQVIIDEVQDYYPIQLAIMKELYGNGKFTVVGDIAQSIERSGRLSAYDIIADLLQKKKTVKLFLNRSYRSSYEINEFAKEIMDGDIDSISFPRHETVPEVFSENNEEKLIAGMLRRIEAYTSEGFETIAVLCKTMAQAKELQKKMKTIINIRLVDDQEKETEKGCMIMPVYMAKGLEFDAVLVYGVDEANYYSELDRRLLYIACTRALHRLSLYCMGKKSRFLKKSSQQY